MKFTIRREELKKVEILEFKGEFERIEEMKMEIEGKTVSFENSYLNGEERPVTDHVIIQVRNKEVEAVAVGETHLLFSKPPKFVPRRRRGKAKKKDEEKDEKGKAETKEEKEKKEMKEEKKDKAEE